MLAWVRNTPACCCMVADVVGHVLGVFAAGGVVQAGQAGQGAVGGVLGQGLCSALGLTLATMWLPAARPNTSRSSSELVPRRLAPCTDTQEHSPTAYRPLTTFWLPLPSGTTTWPLMLVGMPPIW
jgi:hypothetical protein